MPLRTRLPVHAATLLVLTLAAHAATGDPARPPPVPAPSPAAPVIVPPRPLAPLTAAYPEGATGDAEVVVAAVVNADGSVRSARAVSGDEPFLTAAIAASSGWGFEPATRDGKPMAATIRAQIRFRAPAAPEPTPAAPVTLATDASKPAAPGAAAARPPPPPPRALEVSVKGEPLPPGTQSLSRAEVRLLPGAFGDPFRAIDVLPGVTPIASGIPFFFVRGAPPGNVGYYLDGIRVPLLYHIGLGPSVIHPAFMDRVDLYPGGYPAEFGRFAGGIVSGETKPQEPGWHGEANIRLVDAGAMVGAPLPGGVGEALVAGRYSYFTPLLDAIHSSVRLDYWDYQTRVTFHVTARDDLTVFAFGAHDFLSNLQTYHCHGGQNGAEGGGMPSSMQPMQENCPTPAPAPEQQTIFDTTFHRVDLRYDHRFGGPEDRVRTAVTFGYDQTSFPNYCNPRHPLPGCPQTQPPDSYVDDRSVAARMDVHKRVSEAVLLRAGMDAGVDGYGSANLDIAFNTCHRDSDCGQGLSCNMVTHMCPASSGSGGISALFPSHTNLAVGAHVDAVVDVTPRFQVTPGVRLDLFTSHLEQQAWSVEPRLATRLAVRDDLRLVAATGLASQTPSFVLPGPGFARDLTGGLQQAFQLSMGVEADLPWDVTGTLTAFRNAFFNMTDALGSQPLDLNNIGSLAARADGSSIGMEVLLKRRLTRRLGGDHLLHALPIRAHRAAGPGALGLRSDPRAQRRRQLRLRPRLSGRHAHRVLHRLPDRPGPTLARPDPRLRALRRPRGEALVHRARAGLALARARGPERLRRQGDRPGAVLDHDGTVLLHPDRSGVDPQHRAGGRVLTALAAVSPRGTPSTRRSPARAGRT